MRALKFRAWFSKSKAFVYFDLDDYSLMHGVLSAPPDEIQQFTGLLDKNGKEIYEGDLLENKLNPVEFCNVPGGLGSEYPFVGYDINWESKDLKVIGNVFETPHLLETAKR